MDGAFRRGSGCSPPHRHPAGVTYYMASTLIPPRRCVFEGDGAGMEALVTSHTTFSFPSGVNGFQINSNDAAGSIVKRIKVVMQGGAFGGNHARVMEYVSGTGELLILPPTISMPFNVEQDMSWRNFRTLDVSQGTFHWPGWVADAYGRDPTAPVVGRWAKGTIVGTFTANEVITESGGTQVLVGGVLVNKSARFFYQLNDKVVGHTPNAAWNWTPGATLTGQTSGATIVVQNTGTQRDDAYFANVRILSYWQKTGTAFVAGDLVYGTTSGTTGHVWFKSERFNLLILDGVIGQDDDDTDTVTTQAFQIGETVQTAGGAKTAVVSRSRTTSRNFRKAVVSAKSYTGTVDLGGKDTETERVNQGICRSNHFGHAFLLNRRAYLEDCVAFGWSGDGILISSSSAEGGTAGNANLTRIHRFKSSYCMNGARTVGTDGDNAGSFTHCTFNLSSGWHALSRSFYGEEWEVCHGANAMTGTWHSGYNSVRQSAFVNCYDEAAPDLGEYEPVQAMLSGYSHRDGGVWGNPVELADFTSNVGRGGSSQHADFGLRTPTIELDSVTHAQTHKTVGTFNTVQRYRASAEGGETAVWLDFLTTYASGKNGPFDKDGGALMGRIAFHRYVERPIGAIRMRAALTGALTLGSVGGGTGARIFAEVDSGGHCHRRQCHVGGDRLRFRHYRHALGFHGHLRPEHSGRAHCRRRRSHGRHGRNPKRHSRRPGYGDDQHKRGGHQAGHRQLFHAGQRELSGEGNLLRQRDHQHVGRADQDGHRAAFRGGTGGGKGPRGGVRNLQVPGGDRGKGRRGPNPCRHDGSTGHRDYGGAQSRPVRLLLHLPR
jgi:hypothetical protein